MNQSLRHTAFKVQSAVAALVILVVATPVLANVGTPLMWVTGGHLLLGNALIGVFEGAILARLFKVRLRRAILIMIFANYVSMLPGWGIAELLAHWFETSQLRANPLADGWRAIVVSVAAAFLCTIVLEWPFCLWAIWKTGGRSIRALKSSAILQTASYAVLIPLYSTFSHISIYTEATIEPDLGFVRQPSAMIYYINPDDGDIWTIRADGRDKRRALSAGITERNAWLYVKPAPEADGYDLWCVPPLFPDRKLIEVVGRMAAPRHDTEPDLWSNFGPYFGMADHLVVNPDCPVAWRAYAGFWSAEGIGIEKDKRWEYNLALDTPFVQWFCRNVVILPNDQALFQMKDMLLILDMPSRKLGFLTIGRGPVVVMNDPPKPH